jgi:hypothetical protein
LDVDIARIFMRDDEDSEISAETYKVEAFCSGTSLRSLVSGGLDGPPRKPVALLSERSLDGGTISGRHNKGPLTALQLYQALKEPRFRPTQLSNETEEVSYTRRRSIYITDLDRWSICALFGTVPNYQRSAIRSMVYRHLLPRPCTKIDISPDGRSFALAFHLRYSVMRDSATPPNIDQRRFSTGPPLRGYQDVSFLNLGGHHSTYRYEAQISYAVIGTDNSTWDTYHFVDTYFEDGNRVMDVHDEASDPSTWDRREHDPDILDPRQKFLNVLSLSLESIKGEWSRNVRLLCDSIRDFLQIEHDLQNLSKRCRPHQQVQAIERMTKVKELADTLLRDLSDTLEITDEFLVRNRILFEMDLCTPLISQITDIAKELENIRTTLRSVVMINNRLIDNKRLLLSHIETARQLHLLSNFILPIFLATFIFSLPEVPLPFKRNIATFLCVALIVGVLFHFGCDPLYYWEAALTGAARVGSNGYFQAIFPAAGKSLGSKPPADSAVRWQDLEGLLSLASVLSRI